MLRSSPARLLSLALSLVLAVGLVAPPSAYGQPAPPAALPDLIEATLAHEDFGGSTWGLIVYDLNAEQVLYERDPNRLFMPASNAKLFTTAAALEQLGPDYRYETLVFVDGPVRDSTLHGNLIVRGSGDPTIGGYRQQDDPTAVFRAWADSLRAAGIRRIAGNIIGDDDAVIWLSLFPYAG